MAKPMKKRASKYDQKLAIEGSFEDIIKLSVQPPPKAIIPPPKEEHKPKKAAKKK